MNTEHTEDELILASFWARLQAFIIDFNFIIAFLFITYIVSPDYLTYYVFFEELNLGYIYLFVILFLLVFYEALSPSWNGTLGKRTLKLQILTIKRQKSQFLQLLWRTTLKYAITASIIIVFWYSFWVIRYDIYWWKKIGIYFIFAIILFLYNMAGAVWGFPFNTKGQTLYDKLSGILVFGKKTDKKDSIVRQIFRPIIIFGGSVIFLLVIYISIPHFISKCGCNTVASVKANMHTFRTMVENYAVDWKGFYPPDIETLYKDATAKNKWKDFSNPFTRKSGFDKSIMDYKNYKFDQEQIEIIFYRYQIKRSITEFKGIVLYKPVGNPTTKYYIYGCGKDGGLIQDKGQNFVLTNSK